jgi:hypothetical protein
MKASNRQVNGVTVVDMSGRITLGEGSVILRETVKDLLAKGQKKILLNLGDVSYIDSSGIGELGNCPDFGGGGNPASMPRISRLDRDRVSPEVGEIYDHFMRVRGNIPNMFRTVAHRPELLRTLIAHFRAVMETGTVPAKLKELVITRTSQINHCEY